jgi:hypothetical protein
VSRVRFNPLLLVFVGVFLILTVALADGAFAKTEHCPAGGTKTEGQHNDVVLAAGTQVCVKGSTDATGIITADGTSTLFELLGNGHDVSYYVVYEEVQPSETPSPTPSPSVSPTVDPSPTVSPEPPVDPTDPPKVDEPRNDPDGDPKKFDAPKDLAYTGLDDLGAGLIALILLSVGLTGLYLTRKKVDE